VTAWAGLTVHVYYNHWVDSSADELLVRDEMFRCFSVHFDIDKNLVFVKIL